MNKLYQVETYHMLWYLELFCSDEELANMTNEEIEVLDAIVALCSSQEE